ncbi:hypothetical protein IFT73_00820 [Aeromicrobium sp. CFBP 8757]|uniref:hypothetical protein n=1 Tax=Aeromicrobium sp. CFBP 8757 TaxID=2775288 RepID=UPI00177B0D25|nr:hypothetical protein [Aeromicrobium sp. CFBP 8757]MBD8605380.1 hypothetical protein [Aeromicrobium sp. CFBP 8757]
MRIQQERRTNPYPWTWEVPLLGFFIVVLVHVLALQPARAIANLLAGAGWQMPSRENLFSSVPGLLGGDAGAGLAGSGPYASSSALWTWVALAQLILLVVVIFTLVWAARRWGPGRVQGMATAAEAEQLLGVSRLRRNAAVVRPDLYGKRGQS